MRPKNINFTCRDCFYCTPHEKTDISYTGFCRKNTPLSHKGIAYWPEVSLDRDWCGEFVRDIYNIDGLK